jgi:enoyl-CoA hydratase
VPSHIHIEQSGDVAIVRIDRPPANALDLDLLAEGHAVREQLAQAEPGAVVITGRERFFSAGLDLKAVPELSPAQQRQTVDGINRLFSGWYSFPRPVVAAVNGHAIAGGLILALCADHRVCATEGKLGLTELRAGIPYPAAAIAVVRAELSALAARRLVLGAALVEPAEALELGVVDELCATTEEVLPRALEVAAALATLPRATYGVVKRQLRAVTIEAIERVLSGGAGDPVLGTWIGDDTRAAAASLLPDGGEAS